MKTSVFVRGLWGVQPPSPYAQNEQEHGLGKNQIEILNTWNNYPQPRPCLNFVWGEHNAQFMARNKIPFFQIGDDSNSGVSHWNRKFLCIEQALEQFDEVVWLDWDCRMVQQLPTFFWDRLRAGQAFQSKLHWYSKYRSWFRHLRGSKDTRIVPGGGCFYFRDPHLVKHCQYLYSIAPGASDEVIMALLYRDITQQWITPDEFASKGFDFPFYLTKRVFTVPTDVVFVCGTFYESTHRQLTRKRS